MKRNNDSKSTELLSILGRGGIYTTKELAKEMDIDKLAVHSIVRSVRMRFLDGKKVPYIYITGSGYTLEESPEYVAYESKKRLSMGFGILANGVFVFKRCRRIATKEFEALRIQYKPQMFTVKQLTLK